MDMVKTGAFLAELRKEQQLTQYDLGEKLGVSNKTVSRWETGTYMPPVDMLQALSELYGVSINEILSGERLSPESYQAKAEENIKAALNASSFTLNERISYYKKKWKKDHLAEIILAPILWIAVILILKWQGVSAAVGGGIAGMLAILLYGILNNRMMIYVEQRAYISGGDRGKEG